jgi:RimJ/RimL family protein N-acetyltransferase
MSPQLDDREWLALRASTLFHLDPAGRIVSGRDGGHPAPKLQLQRSAGAVVLRLRHDVPGVVADEISALAAEEPRHPPPGPAPRHWEAYKRLLAPIEAEGGGPVYPLPNGLRRAHPGEIVRSGSPTGDAMITDWREQGLPHVLSALGFTDADDVWRPFCLLLLDGEIAAVCQTARLKDGGAEAGVITAPAHRGQSLAAAVTAAWSRHPELEEVQLFYSTSHTNLSSQRVAARLGLVRRAEDFTLT